MTAAEALSTKNAAYENFPVASLLLSAKLRPHVATFYQFARTLDDIADCPNSGERKKIERISGFAAALDGKVQPGYECADRMAESLARTGVSDRHCRNLIAAFKLDAVKNRYHDWDELIGYCRLSANSVGRYLLELHGEQAEAFVCSDALCTALQILNHLQDCRDDFETLDRVYLPMDWLDAQDVPDKDLKGPGCSPGLRRIFDRCLSEVGELLVVADGLPQALSNRRLAMEAAVTLKIAQRLVILLTRRDPLPQRLRLGKAAYLSCCVLGAWRGFFA